MAQMQCYRSCHETCETKCHDKSSFVHKASDLAGKVLGHYPSTQPHCNGQTHGSQSHPHYSSHGQGQCLSQTHHTAKPQTAQCVTNTNSSHGHHGNGTKGQCLGHTTKTQSVQCVTKTNSSHGHHGIKDHSQVVEHKSSCSSSCSSRGVACQCHEKTREKKKKNKCGDEHRKKKDKSHCNNKHKNGNRSCSDDSSGSDSDCD